MARAGALLVELQLGKRVLKDDSGVQVLHAARGNVTCGGSGWSFIISHGGAEKSAGLEFPGDRRPSFPSPAGCSVLGSSSDRRDGVMLVKDAPVTVNFSQTNREPKLELTIWSIFVGRPAVHQGGRKCDFVAGGDLEFVDVEDAGVIGLGEEELPGLFVGFDPLDRKGGGTSNIRISGAWSASIPGMFRSRTARAQFSMRLRIAVSSVEF